MAKKRRGLLYDGWQLDFGVGAVIVGVVGSTWGVHHWNSLPERPLGLPRAPLFRIVQRVLPQPARYWMEGRNGDGSLIVATPGPAETPPPPRATPPSPHPAATPSAAAPSTPTPAPARTPAPPLPSATAAAQVSDDTVTADAAGSPSTSVGTCAVTALQPRISHSDDPLTAAATALTLRKGALFLGLPDGGIAIRERGAAAGIAVRTPDTPAPVRSLAVNADGSLVCWLAGSSDRVYTYRTASRTLRAYDLPPGSAAGAPFDSVALLPGSGDTGTIALFGSGAARFIDLASGQLRDAADVLPEGAAQEANRPATSLFYADAPDGGGRAALLAVSGDNVDPGSPAQVSLWTSYDARRKDAWQQQTVDVSAGPAFSQLLYPTAGRATVALTANSVGLLTPPNGGQTLAAANIWTATLPASGASADATALRPVGTMPEGVFGLWALPERISVGPSGLWWVLGGVVFHEGVSGESPEAYLPWNGAGTDHVGALVADEDGAWVASERGVRHIVPGHIVSTSVGFDGYVRARLGADAGRPPATSTFGKIDALAREWNGTPYKLGGVSRSGIDCSSYVSTVYRGIGVTIPHSTIELASDPTGRHVTDELRYGDVLVYPGHCALYMGNGWTSEAMTDVGVGRATIWKRKQVVIRRYLPAS